MSFTRHAIALRFLVAGGVNSLFGWLSYSTAIVIGSQPWMALIIGLVMGVCFNFITLGGYAFRDMSLKRVPRFVLAYGFIYAVNLLCLTAISPWIDHPIWGQLILTPIIAVLSYFVLSRMVFIQRSST